MDYTFTSYKTPLKRWMARAILLTACGIAVSAQAGEVLRLKSGTVRTDEHSSKLNLDGSRGRSMIAVIQFQAVIGNEDRQGIETLGARVLRYLPDDALVVRATNDVFKTILKSSTAIRTIVPMEADWKISGEFGPESVFNARVKVDTLVRLFPGEDQRRAIGEIRAVASSELLSESGRSLVVRLERQSVMDLAALDSVEWVQPNPRIDVLDMRGLGEATPSALRQFEDITGFETGTKLMNFESAWARGFDGRGQVASMADTGLDMGDIATIHQDFRSRIVAGYPFGLFSKTWEDPMGHGTHVAGSVMGNGQASGGIIRGGAYGATFVAESLWSPMLNNLSVPSRLADLFAKAYAQGARIHTNSWGSAASFGEYDSMAQQADEYTAANPEMLVLFAAGNSGIDGNKDGRVDPNSIGSPATAKNVLTVGASKNYVLKGGLQVKLGETKLKDSWPVEPLVSSRLSENPQGLAPFSSRGPTKDGRLKPEVVAPGTNILSVRSQHKKAEPLWGVYNQDYVWSGGTSMSTPLVAGAATVIRQYLVDDRKIAQPSAALVKAVLMHTAVDLYPGGFGEIGQASGQEIITHRPNIDEGFGRVDVSRATNLASAVLIDEKSGVGKGDAQTYPIHVSGAGKLTATLVYTDAAGSSSAAQALVNDLDLVLVDPSGRETTVADRINNHEIIETAVQSGDYRVKVLGVNVPQGPASGRQPYALIISVN